LIPHRRLDLGTQLALFVRADVAILLGAGRIRIVVDEVVEFLTFFAACR